MASRLPLPPFADLAACLPSLRCALVTAAKNSATDPNPYLAGKVANSTFNRASMVFGVFVNLAGASLCLLFLATMDISAKLPRIAARARRHSGHNPLGDYLVVPVTFDFETLGCLSRWRGSIREVIERIGRLFNDWVPISLSLTCNNRFTSAPAPVAASASPSPKYWPRSACRISAAGESLFPFGLAPRETEARWLTRSPRDGPPP